MEKVYFQCDISGVSVSSTVLSINVPRYLGAIPSPGPAHRPEPIFSPWLSGRPDIIQMKRDAARKAARERHKNEPKIRQFVLDQYRAGKNWKSKRQAAGIIAPKAIAYAKNTLKEKIILQGSYETAADKVYRWILKGI